MRFSEINTVVPHSVVRPRRARVRARVIPYQRHTKDTEPDKEPETL